MVPAVLIRISQSSHPCPCFARSPLIVLLSQINPTDCLTHQTPNLVLSSHLMYKDNDGSLDMIGREHANRALIGSDRQ